MEQLSPSIWRLHDSTAATAYLVVGKRRAAMIDCGTGREPVLPQIRQITQLPVILLATHAHPDHVGASAEFDEIWLHARDAAVLSELEQFFDGFHVPPVPRERLHTFADDAAFDLGGCVLRAVALPGHTPGSTVFVDDRDGAVFVGDAMGSGSIVLMSLPFTSCLSDYAKALAAFETRAEAWADYAWLGGHYDQAGQSGTPDYNPPGLLLVRDMQTLCWEILSGKVQGEETTELLAPNGKALRAYGGHAGIVYLPTQVK